MKNIEKSWNFALLLSIITVVYNILEGVISVLLGISDETLSLFGFGLDSFVEVISGLGILHMVLRVMKRGTSDAFEKTALKITGFAFYLLAAGLSVTAVYNTIKNTQPQTTFWGIIIAIISIVTMVILTTVKLRTGKQLNSAAIIADAHCTRTCVYLSIILLLSSGLYELFKIGFIDSLGALGIAFYAYREGKEAFEKAKGKMCGCGCKDTSC